jgi:hypothetical protein
MEDGGKMKEGMQVFLEDITDEMGAADGSMPTRIVAAEPASLSGETPTGAFAGPLPFLWPRSDGNVGWQRAADTRQLASTVLFISTVARIASSITATRYFVSTSHL